MSDIVNLNVHSEKEVLRKFIGILKFFNEIVKSHPLIVSQKEYLKYKKKYTNFVYELENLNREDRKYYVDFHKELNEPSDDDTNEVNTHPSENNKHSTFSFFTKKSPDTSNDKVFHTQRLKIPEEQKTRFNVYILKKVSDLEKDLSSLSSELEYFYLKYKKYYDRFSISTILLSSSLTLLESITMMFKPHVYTGIITILISTTIAVTTSILKFKNYKEKIEDIVKTNEKIYACQAKLFTFDKVLKSSLNMSSGDTEINIVDEY